MGHGHDHRLDATRSGHRRRLGWVLALTATVFAVELVGGLLSGSLSLVADAGHMLTDSAGLLIAVIGATLAARPPTKHRTYGLQRAEVLAALASGVLLTVIATGVLGGALLRWNTHVEVDSTLMLIVGGIGALANLAGLVILHGGRTHNLNVRGAYLHVLGDLLGSVAVMAAAVIVHLTGYTRADLISAIVIFCLIVPRALGLIREVVDVLLEATPRGLDLDEVRQHLSEVEGVVEVHDLHAWSITSGSPALSAHVVVDDECVAEGRWGQVLDRLGECLDECFAIRHCTLQLEPVAHKSHEHAVHD